MRKEYILMVTLEYLILQSMDVTSTIWSEVESGIRIYGYNTKRHENVTTINVCKELCEQAETFCCKSIEWLENLERCLLSDQNSKTANISKAPDGTMKFYAEILEFSTSEEIPVPCQNEEMTTVTTEIQTTVQTREIQTTMQTIEIETTDRNQTGENLTSVPTPEIQTTAPVTQILMTPQSTEITTETQQITSQTSAQKSETQATSTAGIQTTGQPAEIQTTEQTPKIQTSSQMIPSQTMATKTLVLKNSAGEQGVYKRAKRVKYKPTEAKYAAAIGIPPLLLCVVFLFLIVIMDLRKIYNDVRHGLRNIKSSI